MSIARAAALIKSKEERTAIARRLNRRSTVGILSAILLFVGGTYAIVKFSGEPLVFSQAKQSTKHGPVKLLVEKMNYKGEEVYEFYAAAPDAIYLSLYLSLDGKSLTQIFTGTRIPPGAHRALAIGSEKFRIPVNKVQNAEKFCLLFAASEQEHEILSASRQALSLESANVSCVKVEH
ncbi:MAG: hypothetical protein OEZ47_02240 [Gammaproteobacteria bacterium]|nr:hypothetical protein [Gammaproteobacteria bacterium]